MMPISSARRLLRPGMKIQTNGDSSGTTKFFTATILCVHKEVFYTTAPPFGSGRTCYGHNRKAHVSSWAIRFSSQGELEILEGDAPDATTIEEGGWCAEEDSELFDHGELKLHFQGCSSCRYQGGLTECPSCGESTKRVTI